MTMVAPAIMVILLSGCAEYSPAEKRAYADSAGDLVFTLNDSVDVRIPSEWTGDILCLRNGEESLYLEPTGPETWVVPVFDGTVSLHADTGHWHDVLRPGEYRVPLRWEDQAEPAPTPHWSPDTLSWKLQFGEEDPWLGQLYMQTSGTRCRGSIATATGDFRYLHGTLDTAGQLVLQTFDGAHLFRFSAQRGKDGMLTQGQFFSGTHYRTPFVGTPSPADSSALTAAPAAQWTGLPVRYAGLNLDGDSIEWAAENHTVPHILSVMGSWCPNCMDEHRLLLRMMERHPDLHVHTLAFERSLDQPGGTERALARLRRFQQNMGIDAFGPRWTLTLVGPASKSKAQEALPFLDRVVSFPTSIVHQPGDTELWIHSGFNGPAMGPAHELEVSRFESAISGLTGNR